MGLFDYWIYYNFAIWRKKFCAILLPRSKSTSAKLQQFSFVKSSCKFIHLTTFLFWCEIWNIALNLFFYKSISMYKDEPVSAIITFSNQDIVQKAKDDLDHWSLNQLLLSKKLIPTHQKKSDILYRDTKFMPSHIQHLNSFLTCNNLLYFLRKM